MSAHVFEVGGIQLIAGLFWQPLTEGNANDKQKEIKVLAKELNFDMYVLRKTPIDCVGFANQGGDVKYGQSSAAAIISKSMDVELGVEDFIFVTQLPDGNWIYVAQRDGLILPDGDQVFASEDAAKSHLLEDISLGEWSVVVAPSIWGVKKSIERSIESMFPTNGGGKIKVHQWWKMKYVESSKEIGRHKVAIGLVVIALAVAAGGFKYYQDYKHKKEMEAAALAAQQLIAEQNKQAIVEHPWKSLPIASDILNACMAASSSAQLFPGNWDLIGINCANGTMNVSWKPKGDRGWIEHLKAIQPNAVISLDGSMASIDVPLADSPKGYDEPLKSQNDRLVEMYSAAQRYGFKFTVAPAVVPVMQVLPGQENANTPPPTPDWAEINWKAEGIALPQAVLAGLEGDGFRMKSMSAAWQNGKFIYTMEGTQYVKP
jgi:hypothetical protein